MAKQYKRLGLGRLCPKCIVKAVVLLELATDKVFDHCGSCKRSWYSQTKPPKKDVDTK